MLNNKESIVKRSIDICFMYELEKELSKKILSLHKDIEPLIGKNMEYNTKLYGLLSLSNKYLSQRQLLYVILGKANKLMYDSEEQRLKTKGVPDKYFINIL